MAAQLIFFCIRISHLEHTVGSQSEISEFSEFSEFSGHLQLFHWHLFRITNRFPQCPSLE